MESKTKSIENVANEKDDINWADLYKEASEMKIENLQEFINRIKDYGNGYDSAVKATGLASVATAWALCRELGLTGFQASCVNWEFLRGWFYTDNSCGMKLIDYDKMLYPQYSYRFEKTISSKTWESLKKEAEEYLKRSQEDNSFASQNVINHWKSIVSGVVPFGYSVID